MKKLHIAFIALFVFSVSGCSLQQIQQDWPGQHRAYFTGTVIGGNLDTLKPGVRYEYEGSDGWRFNVQLIDFELPQIGITKQFTFYGKIQARVGPSYVIGQRIESIQCSQLNARVGLAIEEDFLHKKGAAFLDHDSNGSLCSPNPGLNTIGYGFNLK